MSGAAARTGSLIEKKTKNIRKRIGLRRLINMESHVQKQKRDNRTVYV